MLNNIKAQKTKASSNAGDKRGQNQDSRVGGSDASKSEKSSGQIKLMADLSRDSSYRKLFNVSREPSIPNQL